MKKVLFIGVLALLSFTFFVSCTKKEDKIENDLTKESLIGKVKSVKEASYNTVEKFGEIIKADENKSTKTMYNETGNMIEYKSYVNGELDIKKTYKYDDKDSIIEYKYYDEDGTLNGKTTYKYDEKGNKIKEGIYYKSELSWMYDYVYDDNGNQIEWSSHTKNGELSFREILKYNKEGKKLNVVDTHGVRVYLLSKLMDMIKEEIILNVKTINLMGV